MKRVLLAAAAIASFAFGQQAFGQNASGQKMLDFETYRTRVEPIFIKHRPEHARCAACHTASASNFKLLKLSAPGAATWTESIRKNFANVSRLVIAGDPSKSRLLIHPLAPEAGGDDFHGGGHQFKTKDDPDWKIIADWISSAK